MALAKGTNSYATRAEANSYFADRLDVAAWTDASDPQKEQSLVTATGMLDDLRWLGAVQSTSQALAWPRAGSYFDPRLGSWVVLDTTVPDRIVKATYELAHHLLANDGLLDDTGRIKTIAVGPIKLESVRQPPKFPGVVTRFTKPLLYNQGANSWWRAN